MRILLSVIPLFLVLSAVPAQQHDEWREVRPESDDFSIEMPGNPKVVSHDFGNGASQRFFTVEIGPETYFVSVVQQAPGKVPASPDQTYFSQLMKAYVDGSKTTLRSSHLTTWAGHAAMEGIADAEDATHLIDITTAGDRAYLVVFAGAKGSETESRATRMRDSFKLLSK